MDYLFYSIFLALFSKKITVLLKKKILQKKAIIVEEKLNCADIDDIENLEDLPRFVLIDEKCRNLKVVKDGGELTRNINQKKNSDVS